MIISLAEEKMQFFRSSSIVRTIAVQKVYAFIVRGCSFLH